MSEVRTLTVTLETVTPLFLGGANPSHPPELRAPSVRGALRYWLRAALGGVIGDANLEGLRKLEQAVFGSTDYGSPIAVQLHGLEGKPLSVKSEFILPHQQSGRRKAFSAEQPMMLVLHQVRSNNEAVWKMACATISLAITFGGVGLRSRRGYGTLRVKSVAPAIVPTTPSTLVGWKTHVQQVAEQAISAAEALAQAHGIVVSGLPTGPATYPCATQMGILRISELKPAPTSAMEAVVAFMRKAKKVRALGGIDPRQASPLWVRPIEIGDHYALLFVTLASKFRGSNYATVKAFLDNSFAGKDITAKGMHYD